MSICPPRKSDADSENCVDNSPFVVPDNAASNQQLGVLDQLNDGIRMLETETHYNSTTSTVSCCHTSCDLLDVGTVQSYLTNITAWIKTHPYDVVTILLSNSDFISVGNYSAPIVNSGLSNYAVRIFRTMYPLPNKNLGPKTCLESECSLSRGWLCVLFMDVVLGIGIFYMNVASRRSVSKLAIPPQLCTTDKQD